MTAIWYRSSISTKFSQYI